MKSIKITGFLIILLHALIDMKAAIPSYKNEPLYAIVPLTWNDSIVNEVFGIPVIRVDTSKKLVHPEVRRLGIAGKTFAKLPFAPVMFPNIEQLLIAEEQEIPTGIEDIVKLKSLIIGKINVNPNRKNIYYDEGFSENLLVVDTVLRKLKKLEELALPFANAHYLSDHLFSSRLRKIGNIWLTHLPFSFFDRSPKISIGAEFDIGINVPYPEMLVLMQTNPDIFINKKFWLNYYDIMEMDKDTLSCYPFTSQYQPLLLKQKRVNIPRNGTFRLFYPCGTELMEGKMKNAKPHGKWTFWYPDGNVCEERYYDQGVEIGTWVIYNFRSDTLYATRFKEGTMHILITFNYQPDEYNVITSSQLTHSYRFENSILDNSIISTHVEYANFDEQHKIKVIHTKYYRNYFCYHTILQHFKNDTLVRWYCCWENEFVNNDSLGRYTRFCLEYPGNGEVNKTSYFVGKTIDSTWYSDKKLKSVYYHTSLINDTSYYRLWNEHGELVERSVTCCKRSIEGEYSCSKKITRYYSNGAVKQQSEMEGDLLHGETIFYDERGLMICTRIYSRGYLMSESNCDL